MTLESTSHRPTSCARYKGNGKSLHVLWDDALPGFGLRATPCTRLAWVEGQLHARLNHWRAADQRRDAAHKALVRQGPDRYALAVAVDHCLLYTHRPSDDSRRRILAILGSCDRRLKQLEPEIKKKLKLMKSVISQQPRNTP